MVIQADTAQILGRLEAFRQSDAERDALLLEVVKAYETLKEEFEEQTADYNNEKESRRAWQSKANATQKLINQHTKQSASSNFAVALIDGDGALALPGKASRLQRAESANILQFQDFLYKQGKDGGYEAAGLLHTEIQNHLQEVYPESNVTDWNIVVQVICNLQGLTSALNRAGIISNHTELSEFGRSFGLARPLFNFIDVGAGKERADHKIKETLRFYLPLAQCKHVLFAPCHDNGYLPFLESYRMDKARITLVETRPCEPGYARLGFNMISMPRVFRSEDVPAAPARSAAIPVLTKAQPPRLSPPASVAHSEKSTASSPLAIITNGGAAGSWATVGKSGAGSKTINISPQKAPSRKYVLLNAYGERLDEALPRVDTATEARFQDTVKQYGKNLCNAYHLSGYCKNGTDCPYAHAKKLTPGELTILKSKSRGLRCPTRLDCRDVECTLGHNCKFAGNCPTYNCHFDGTHDIDREPAKRYFDDSTEEWIPVYLEKHAK